MVAAEVSRRASGRRACLPLGWPPCSDGHRGSVELECAIDIDAVASLLIPRVPEDAAGPRSSEVGAERAPDHRDQLRENMLCGSHDLFEPAAFVLPIDARTAGQGPRFCVVSSAVLVHQTTRLVTREASVGFGRARPERGRLCAGAAQPEVRARRRRDHVLPVRNGVGRRVGGDSRPTDDALSQPSSMGAGIAEVRATTRASPSSASALSARGRRLAT